jgi:hypothetical protein
VQPPAADSSLIRAVINSATVFREFDSVLDTYIERYVALQDDASTSLDDWLLERVVTWPGRNASFIRDVLEIIDNPIAVSVTEPADIAKFKEVLSAYVNGDVSSDPCYPSPSGNYYLFGFGNASGLEAALITKTSEPSFSDLDEDSYTAEVPSGFSSTGAAYSTASFKGYVRMHNWINSMIYKVKHSTTDWTLTGSHDSIPTVAGPAVAGTYLRIKFLRDHASVSCGLSSSEYADLVDAATTFLI